jgi:hypothetical protein
MSLMLCGVEVALAAAVNWRRFPPLMLLTEDFVDPPPLPEDADVRMVAIFLPLKHMRSSSQSLSPSSGLLCGSGRLGDGDWWLDGRQNSGSGDTLRLSASKSSRLKPAIVCRTVLGGGLSMLLSMTTTDLHCKN